MNWAYVVVGPSGTAEIDEFFACCFSQCWPASCSLHLHVLLKYTVCHSRRSVSRAQGMGFLALVEMLRFLCLFSPLQLPKKLDIYVELDSGSSLTTELIIQRIIRNRWVTRHDTAAITSLLEFCWGFGVWNSASALNWCYACLHLFFFCSFFFISSVSLWSTLKCMHWRSCHCCF